MQRYRTMQRNVLASFFVRKGGGGNVLFKNRTNIFCTLPVKGRLGGRLVMGDDSVT